MKRVGVFPVTQTMLFTTKKILCGFICTFFFCVAPFIICSFLHSLYRRASVEARPDLLSHVYTSKLLHAAASKHSGKHSSTPGYALLLWSLFAVCVWQVERARPALLVRQPADSREWTIQQVQDRYNNVFLLLVFLWLVFVHSAG